MLAMLLLSCNNPAPLSLLPFQDDIEKVNGETARTSAKAVVIQNPIGGLIVTGSNVQQALRWSLTKTISARGQSNGSNFSQIVMQTSLRNDTLFFEIKAPQDTDEIKYLCGLALVMPANMACHVASATGLIHVSNLDTVLTIQQASYDMSIAQHRGSCELDALQGSITLEQILPDNGFCFVKTAQGNISLKLPEQTSARVAANTSTGSLNYSGLVFTQIEEQTAKSLRATLGEGRGQITLDTVKGEIFLQGF
jgi:hypothetical protein